MINDDLINYIDSQKLRGIDREAISIKLSEAGWKMEDIKEGLEKVFPVVSESTIPKSNEALIPNLMPKISGPAGAVPIEKTQVQPDTSLNQKVNVDPRSSSFDSFRPQQKIEPIVTANVMSPGPLPQGAVISSYRKDYQNLETISREPGGHVVRSILITIFILLILGGGGVIFASVKGYINLPFEIPFFKPSPEQAILKMAGNLAKIKTVHYSTDFETSVTLTEQKPVFDPSALNTQNTIHSLPPVGQTDLSKNIDMSNNEPAKPVTSKMKIHAETDSDVNNILSPKSQSTFNINMSLFGGLSINLDSEFRVVDEVSYLKIPDIALAREFIGEANSWISFKKSDINELSNLNADLPISVPQVYDEAKVTQIKDLIESTKFADKTTEVGIEKLGNESTHHYQLTLDKEVIKNFVGKLIDIMDNPDINASRTDLLGKLDSLNEMKMDVWLAKGSFEPRKYVFTFSTNEFSLEDSTKVKINMVITSVLSKINEPLEITIPTGARPIIDDLKTAKMKSEDAQIKATLSSFGAEAKKFSTKHKNSYGIQSPSGNCINPVKDSLFYNSEMINYLNQTIKVGASCYSTPKEWAVSVPLSTDSTTMWCVDSTGTSKEIKTQITGPVCK